MKDVLRRTRRGVCLESCQQQLLQRQQQQRTATANHIDWLYLEIKDNFPPLSGPGTVYTRREILDNQALKTQNSKRNKIDLPKSSPRRFRSGEFAAILQAKTELDRVTEHLRQGACEYDLEQRAEGEQCKVNPRPRQWRKPE